MFLAVADLIIILAAILFFLIYDDLGSHEGVTDLIFSFITLKLGVKSGLLDLFQKYPQLCRI